MRSPTLESIAWPITWTSCRPGFIRYPRPQMRALAGTTVAFLFALAACSQRGPRVEVATAHGTVTFAVEVAISEPHQTQGLMYRKELASDRGMLFVFPQDEDHSFWMKNTLIPLDMLFIADTGQIVGIHPNATPLSTAGISVGHPSRYVLEIAGGEAARQGIQTGDRVTMHAIPAG